MQAVDLPPTQRKYSLEIASDQQSQLDAILNALSQVRSAALINVYQFDSQPQGADRLYSLVTDQVADKLSARIARREAMSQAEIDALAKAGIVAMAIAQEQVRCMQRLPLVGLSDDVLYVSAEGEVKVNLLEGIMQATDTALVQILYKAVFFQPAESREHLQQLESRLSPEVFAGLMAEQPDYVAMRRLFEPAPEAIKCHHCGLTKVPTIPQVCETHKVCSDACLSAIRGSSSAPASVCPLCTIKRHRKVVVNPKRLEEQKCAKCGNGFRDTESEGWRLEKIGSSLYESSKTCCSEACFQALYVQPEEAKRAVGCIACGREMLEGGRILHCGNHGLCSPKCGSVYYKSDNLASHQLDGAMICYQCLEQYLADVGSGDGLPELNMLRSKLASFKGDRRIKGDEHFGHATGCHCFVINCGYYLSPELFGNTNYQTYCIFCSTEIMITKHMDENFRLNNDMPLLLSCEFRVHGVCSRDCLRANVPNADDPKSIRCPRCPDSLFYAEVLVIALNDKNPTLECIKRTPVGHVCHSGAPTVALPGCRHEFCSKMLDGMVNDDGRVYCPCCGNSATLEEAIAAQFTYTQRRLGGS